MKFGIIICPKCKKVKGIDLSFKTTRCTRCGSVLKIEKLKIFYKTSSIEKLQYVIGLINSNKDGNLNDFKKIMKNML